MTSPVRWRALPDTPTLTELGWYGRAGMPASRVLASNTAAMVREDHAYWGQVVQVTWFKPQA